MKKSSQFSLFEFRRITLVVIGFAVLLLGRPVFAGNINVGPQTIDITENSSTSLTLVFNGVDITSTPGAVMLTSSDHWTLTFPSTIQFGVFNNGWAEPGGGPFDANILIGQGTNQLLFISDGVFASTIFPNNSTQLIFGNIGGFQVPFDTTIHDNGDGPVGVPESGSTLALCFLSLAALLGATRLRSSRFV